MSRTWKSRVGVLALTATMGIGIVGIAGPAGADPPKDQVTGTVQGINPTGQGLKEMKVHVNASVTATGDAKGQFSVDIFDDAGTASGSGRVSCVAVIGNTAIVRGVIDTTHSSFWFPQGLVIHLKLVDNGSGNDPVDQMGVFQAGSGSQSVCSNLGGTVPTTAGNVTAFDGV